MNKTSLEVPLNLYINLSLIAASFFYVQFAHACAGAGLTKTQLFDLVSKAEPFIKADKKLSNSKIDNIIWADIKTRSGAEGDCHATGLKAKISAMAENSAGDYCEFEGTVEIFKSKPLGNRQSVIIDKGTYCLW